MIDFFDLITDIDLAFQESKTIKRRHLILPILKNLSQNRDLLEDLVFDCDPIISFFAFHSLKKIFPQAVEVSEIWRETFDESIQILRQRVLSGPVAVRICALQALLFAPIEFTSGLVDLLIQSLLDTNPVSPLLSQTPPKMPLINIAREPEIPEGLALIISSIAKPFTRISLLKRELRNPERGCGLPTLLSLQIFPVPELTSEIIPFIRASDSVLATEAVCALYACGGEKVFPLLITHLNETTDPLKKAVILRLIGQSTDHEEVWNLLKLHLKSDDVMLCRIALSMVALFPYPAEDKVPLLYEFLNDRRPEIAAEAAVWLWKMGSMEALNRLETMLRDNSGSVRAIAAKAFGRLPYNLALPRLIELLGAERHGDTRREILLALRRLLPLASENYALSDRLIPIFRRYLECPDNFIRNQTAVLCGSLGASTMDILLSALDREEHPHVIASIIRALGKIGTPGTLVLAKFYDHPDPRVRANLMEAFYFCGPAAIPYLTGGLKDPSVRVRSAAAFSLFMLGQIEVVGVLNRMLLNPSPVSVVSACYTFGKIFRHFPDSLPSDHPVVISLKRFPRRTVECLSDLPFQLQDRILPKLFQELISKAESVREQEEVLKKFVDEYPDSFALRRLYASFAIETGSFQTALILLEKCLEEHPNVLVDQFDFYRIAIAAKAMDKAEKVKPAIVRNYKTLLNACLELCQELKGKGSEKIMEKLMNLQQPSMNLYNAMIQIKLLQNETETVLELLAELLLARPRNAVIIGKLIEMLPVSAKKLKAALQRYVATLVKY